MNLDIQVDGVSLSEHFSNEVVKVTVPVFDIDKKRHIVKGFKVIAVKDGVEHTLEFDDMPYKVDPLGRDLKVKVFDRINRIASWIIGEVEC